MILRNKTFERNHLEGRLLRARFLQHPIIESQRPRSREAFINSLNPLNGRSAGFFHRIKSETA
jgi:hypothetical protein